MSRDIVVFDKLAEIKQLTNNEAFLHLEKRFQEERNRFISKMLHPETDKEETLHLKAVVNSLEALSPMAIAERLLKIQSKQLKSEHPELWKTKKHA
jgi:hypothetical protein